MTIVAPIIETERLRLRPYALTDLEDLADIRRRPDVMRYLYQDIQSPEEVAAVLHQRATAQTALRGEGDTLVLAVELTNTGRVIGDVSMRWTSERHQQGDIGFIFHPDYHGKGYAHEAAREMLRLGFVGVGFHRIEGRCDARNDASARLMERLGMRREAHLIENERFKGEWGSELVYAILDREWRARQG